MEFYTPKQYDDDDDGSGCGNGDSDGDGGENGDDDDNDADDKDDCDEKSIDVEGATEKIILWKTFHFAKEEKSERKKRIAKTLIPTDVMITNTSILYYMTFLALIFISISNITIITMIPMIIREGRKPFDV